MSLDVLERALEGAAWRAGDLADLAGELVRVADVGRGRVRGYVLHPNRGGSRAVWRDFPIDELIRVGHVPVSGQPIEPEAAVAAFSTLWRG